MERYYGKKESGWVFKNQVGDIIKIQKGEDIPCDMVILQTSERSTKSQCFITTTNIDGETDIKTKVALQLTSQRSFVLYSLICFLRLLVESPPFWKSIRLFVVKPKTHLLQSLTVYFSFRLQALWKRLQLIHLCFGVVDLFLPVYIIN